ncbi:MAG: hypothetical protein ACK41C_20805 [Phenylobacterium sp.]|uniref:hypothetical protein n=1 Tax=Phenylobacterium sp. TaxID=1871053 RepID=UPI00391AC036
MRLQYGRYQGRTAETLLLRAPDYAVWVMRHQPEGRLAQYFRDLITAFDARPINQPCQACGAAATRAAALPERSDLYFFCDDCALYPNAAPAGAAQDLRTLADFVSHVERTARRRPVARLRAFVRRMAQAKGLPRRITEPAAEAFFAGETM